MSFIYQIYAAENNVFAINGTERTKRKEQKLQPSFTVQLIQLSERYRLSSCNLAGSETTRANVNCLVFAVTNNCLNSSDVGLPSSVCLSVGVGYIVTECNTLAAYFALCHFCCTSLWKRNSYRIRPCKPSTELPLIASNTHKYPYAYWTTVLL